MKEDSSTNNIPGWNYIPKVPILVSPFFTWPINPKRMINWLISQWVPLSENLILLFLVLISWGWLQPSLEDTKIIQVEWVMKIWLRNLALMILVAGSLHWFFYSKKKQGNVYRYDKRDRIQNGPRFIFKKQLYDNIFWSLLSGVGFWTAYEVLMFWLMSNDLIPVMIINESPILFVLWFFLTPIWISFHFYWIHRFLHWGPIYKWFHEVHHRNINIGPWSGLSMHPGEHLIYFTSILIHLIFMAHPLHILFHMQSQTLTAASSHTGYAGLLIKDKNCLKLGTFHHQMHHRYFEVNYGSLEIPWDKWFGTFHNGTFKKHQELKSRHCSYPQ